MEVYFVDVGQGTCQVILLGDQRAIVIDCGIKGARKSDHIALHFLKRHDIKRIECLITSHSDRDHTGGAISILDAYADNIGRIFVIQDHKFLTTKYWQRIDYFARKGVIGPDQVFPLHIEGKPRLLWSESETQLRCFSPTYMGNLQSQVKEDTNSTSAVLILDHLGRRIVFAADSVIAQWREIYEKRGNKTLECDVLAVSHHGGLCNEKAGDLDWLYDHALNAKIALLSVGTVKNPEHPRQEVVAKLRSVGSTVLCTELTRLCHPKPQSLKPGVLQPQTHLGRSIDQPSSQWTACAGTVKIEFNDNGCAVDKLNEHQNAVDSLAQTSAEGVCPLCRLVPALGAADQS
ncbi:MBL fold metallo-hydrolase [Mariniblastus sp.]|nr:MBL fold metallo-hydrolase [Mariniblastus sp.]